MSGSTFWVPIDRRDVEQERALAILERRCPDAAARAWYQKERLWYRFHLSFPEEEGPDYVDAWIVAFRAAMPQDLIVNRSAESMEQRREYVREWWRKNGATYRRTRPSSRGSRRVDSPRSRSNAAPH